MTTSCRSGWRNCALETDSEILDIDRMENPIAPIATNESRIRVIIPSLYLCHRKAERWILKQPQGIWRESQTGEIIGGLKSSKKVGQEMLSILENRL